MYNILRYRMCVRTYKIYHISKYAVSVYKITIHIKLLYQK